MVLTTPSACWKRGGLRRLGLRRSRYPQARASPPISAMSVHRPDCGSTGERPTAPTSRSRSPKTARTSAKWDASRTDKGSTTISIGRAQQGASSGSLCTRQARPKARPSSRSSSASSARTGCRSGCWKGRPAPGAATSIRNRCCRQVYWTVLAEAEEPEEALFDEYGDLEPQQGGAQITPLLRVDGKLHGAPGSDQIRRSLFGGSLPLPAVAWTAQGMEVQARGLAHAGQALVEYRVLNSSDAPRTGALVLAVRPVQINSYWQHGGDAPVNAIGIEGRQVRVNDRIYATFSRDPDAVTVADFDGGDAVRLIEQCACGSDCSLRSDFGLLSAAFEFAFDLQPGAAAAVTVACPMREGVAPDAGAPFSTLGKEVARDWRKKIGPRKIQVGDPEVTETIHAQTGLILANMTRTAFRPGPRNYDRVWIRDGSSQALALLWAGQPEPAKAFVLWYSKRIYELGLVPPILDRDGKPYKGFGGDLEFDAQGQFVWIAAEVYRITRDRAFLESILEPVVRATKFIETLSEETNARHGEDKRFRGLLCPSISHEACSTPTYSYWGPFLRLERLAGLPLSGFGGRRSGNRSLCQVEGGGIRDESHPVHPHSVGTHGKWHRRGLRGSIGHRFPLRLRSPSSPAVWRTSFLPNSCKRPTTIAQSISNASARRIIKAATRLTSCATSTPSWPWAVSKTLSSSSISCSPTAGRKAAPPGPRSSGILRARRNISATCPTPGSGRSSSRPYEECWSGKTAARSNCCARAGQLVERRRDRVARIADRVRRDQPDGAAGNFSR